MSIASLNVVNHCHHQSRDWVVIVAEHLTSSFHISLLHANVWRSVWMIFQFTRWWCQPFFLSFFLCLFFLPKAVSYRSLVERLLVFMTCPYHFNFLFLMGLFLIYYVVQSFLLKKKKKNHNLHFGAKFRLIFLLLFKESWIIFNIFLSNAINKRTTVHLWDCNSLLKIIFHFIIEW